MFYIFNHSGTNIGYCDLSPNLDDLQSRNEVAIESDILYSTDIEYIGGEIREITPPELNLTEEERIQQKRAQYLSLTRYQFKRCLLENGFKSETIESKILTIEDEFERELVLLGFKEATNFVRMDDSILAMQKVLGLSDEKIDELWEYALTL